MASKTKTAAPAKTAPKPKDKRANFIRLAQGRANNAVKAIQLIGNLSNTNDYEFKDSDLAKILDPIRDELASTEARFKTAKQKIARKRILIED